MRGELSPPKLTPGQPLGEEVVAAGVRANGGFRVWDAKAAWPSRVTLRLGVGIP
jgi:hypothetical protein